jgi:hypothetical protein
VVLAAAFAPPALADTCDAKGTALGCALPVPGGQEEVGAWWLAAVNCIDEEQWLAGATGPRAIMRTLPPTIAPTPVSRLAARSASIAEWADLNKYPAFVPAALPRDGGKLFPRVIVGWDADEIPAQSQYLFLERETEQPSAGGAARLADDPAWGYLKQIEDADTGGLPWDPLYETALAGWLKGGRAPQPPGSVELGTDRYFFSVDTRQAWDLRDVDMLSGMPLITDMPNAKSPRHFVDYFAAAPGQDEGDSSQPTLGDNRFRYRAYAVTDLMPWLGDPGADRFHERFLVSEASAWTPWVRPEWPATTVLFEPDAQETARGDGPLVSFAVSCEFMQAHHHAVAAQQQDNGLCYRVGLRRDLPGLAFGGSAGAETVLVGETLDVDLTPKRGTPPPTTADHALEADDPAGRWSSTYAVSTALIWKQANGAEVVLRSSSCAAMPTPVTGSGPTRARAVKVRLVLS